MKFELEFEFTLKLRNMQFFKWKYPVEIIWRTWPVTECWKNLLSFAPGFLRVTCIFMWTIIGKRNAMPASDFNFSLDPVLQPAWVYHSSIYCSGPPIGSRRPFLWQNYDEDISSSYYLLYKNTRIHHFLTLTLSPAYVHLLMRTHSLQGGLTTW